MSKKDYIDAINEIKADEQLKRRVISKMKNKRGYWGLVAKIATSVAMVGCIVMLLVTVNKDNIETAQENLKTVGTYENLCELLKENDYYNDYYSDIKNVEILEDSLDMSPSINASNLLNNESNTTDDFSGTNVQVEGVDEADIVKTDGKYLYYIAENKVVIVDVQNNQEMKVLSKIEFEKLTSIEEMFVKNDKLVVIGESGKYYNMSSVALIYNIKSRENPKLDREIEVEGNYLSARMIDNDLYLIANEYVDIDDGEDECKPYYIDTEKSDEKQYLDYDKIYCFEEVNSNCYINIIGVNIEKNKKANMKSYLGAGEDIYVSGDNLYVVGSKTKYSYTIINEIFQTTSSVDIKTDIYKFSLKDAIATYETKGEVPGQILNQFSMDEYNGYFRIATTNRDNNWETNNNLYVLNENLEIVGSVENLAEGEKIYSVRFMGEKAYVVTYVQVDPLFVIDLSNPEKPTVLGELKIPGYSDYLHPYDENHIIGFGKNTEYNGYSTTTKGMKMALFDVTDPTNPIELYSIEIGDSGTYSELLDNHKALLFSKEKNIIAFPITIREQVEEKYYSTRQVFQGAIVYGLDLEKGFEVRGTITHKNEQDSIYSYDYSNNVERILYVEDTLFTVSPKMIKATDMNTMKEISNVKI